MTSGFLSSQIHMLMMFVFSKFRQTAPVAAALMMAICSAIMPATAQNQASTENAVPENKTVIKGSGYPVPRFVTLKSDKVNLRVGPGQDYPIEWVYVRKNLPVKVVSEFDIWRKIIDHEGVTGWVHGQLVSLKRYAIVTAPVIRLRTDPNETAAVSAIAEKNVILELQYCQGGWCRLSADNAYGWARRTEFWGAIDDEVIN